MRGRDEIGHRWTSCPHRLSVIRQVLNVATDSAKHFLTAEKPTVLVDVAVSSYLRQPGHAGVERMYASQISTCGVHAIRMAFDRAGLLRQSEVAQLRISQVSTSVSRLLRDPTEPHSFWQRD